MKLKHQKTGAAAKAFLRASGAMERGDPIGLI